MRTKHDVIGMIPILAGSSEALSNRMQKSVHYVVAETVLANEVSDVVVCVFVDFSKRRDNVGLVVVAVFIPQQHVTLTDDLEELQKI